MSDTFKNEMGCYKAEIFLHEVSHIKTGFEHNSEFYEELGRLLEYFKNDIPNIK